MTLTLFTSFPHLFVAISTKADGAMRAKNQLENSYLPTRTAFLKKNGITPQQVVSTELVHGNTIHKVVEEDLEAVIPRTDGFITNKRNVFLAITTADCLPIFLYDPTNDSIGLVHAGWRGLEKEIIASAITNLQECYGCKPENILAVIGPGIGVCHFEVQEDLLLIFKEYPQAIETKNGKHFLNLKEIAKKQLQMVGIRQANTEVSPLCTYCEENLFFSHRRGHQCPEEVMMSIIGMK